MQPVGTNSIAPRAVRIRMHNWYCDSTAFRISAFGNVDVLFFFSFSIRPAMCAMCAENCVRCVVAGNYFAPTLCSYCCARRVRSKVKRFCGECGPPCACMWTSVCVRVRFMRLPINSRYCAHGCCGWLGG